MPKNVLPYVPKSGGPENTLYLVAAGSKIHDLAGKKSTIKAKSGVGEQELDKEGSTSQHARRGHER